jgi:hypothetical protein
MRDVREHLQLAPLSPPRVFRDPFEEYEEFHGTDEQAPPDPAVPAGGGEFDSHGYSVPPAPTYVPGAPPATGFDSVDPDAFVSGSADPPMEDFGTFAFEDIFGPSGPYGFPPPSDPAAASSSDPHGKRPAYPLTGLVDYGDDSD